MKWFWRILAAGMSLTILVSGAWLIAVPEGLLRDVIETPRGDISAEAGGLSKGWFFNFRADEITLIRQDKEILTIENVSCRINPLPLLLLKVSLEIEGDLAGGRLAGRATLHRKGISASVRVDAADASGIAFLSSLGVVERGTLSGDLSLRDGSGEVRFSLDDARLKDRVFSGVPVPLSLFRAAKAALTVKDGSLSVTSFSLKGEGIYARVKGDVKARVLDLTIEIMPDASFKEKPFLWAIMQYQVSPGYYVIPVRGDLTQGS
ncbi:MAG: type II secretion system protein GspN [Thermodesulfovibrionales bacterium]|nr:type II secretion system protein GspN [Thermodesulfovibrionales bacterium]